MITSPCIKVCVLDEAGRLCAGCGRTLDEIAGWMQRSEAERLGIMAALPERLASVSRGDVDAKAEQVAS